MLRLVFVVIVSLAMMQSAWSQTLSKEEIVKGLLPDQIRPLNRSVRGVSVEPDESSDPPSINLKVEFEFDSAELSAPAMQTLTLLGEALTDERLQGFRFRVAGHTDAKGSDAYNLALSERRANAVDNFLMAVFGIAPDRLEPVGLGETQLLDRNHPEDAINRRVQITNIGDEGE